MLESIIIPGIGDISRELEAEFRRGWVMEAALAKARQIEAAEVRRRLGLEAAPTELGELAVQIDPFWYHYWGRREGYEIWSDRKEVETFIRDTPELKIERRKSPTVSFAGCAVPVLEGRPVAREERMLVKVKG